MWPYTLTAFYLLLVRVVSSSIPEYVYTYAPVVYFHENETFFPTDIKGFLDHSRPYSNYTLINDGPKSLSLDNLDQLNPLRNCTVEDFINCQIFLSQEDYPAGPELPAWLYGVRPNPVTRDTSGAKSAVVVVNDHGNGTVDAYYLFFFGYNRGPGDSTIALNETIGNHPGDWEHVMIRFTDNIPKSIWYSQHQYGTAYTWNAVKKDSCGRPLVYSALGTHASYPTAGEQDTFVFDRTSAGPLWDPLSSAYYYNFKPKSRIDGTFTSPQCSTPIAWLHFLGRWGDQRLPNSDPRQGEIFGAYYWGSGPTGPLDKQLNRDEVCPVSALAENCQVLNSTESPSLKRV